MAFLERNANSGSVSTGFNIGNSLKFEADNTEYMHYTPSGQTDYERMAFSVWVKRTELSTAQLIMEFGNGTANTSNLRIGFDTSDRLFCYGNSIIWRQTQQVFRDTSAWYHLFFLFDTTTPGGVSNNRIRIWVNGSMIDHGNFGTINNPGSGSSMGFNNSLKQSLGRQTEDATSYFCGYMAQVYGSGGTPPVVGDFGETDDNGIWIPKDISEITPPDANGFNLDFSNSGSLGNDISSRNNDFTLVNIAAADQATDTPTNNFCTFNPINMYGNTAKLAEGATFTASTANGAFTTYGTMAPSAGKWWWEGKIQVFTSGSNVYACIGATTNLAGLPSVSAQLSGGHVIKLATNQKWVLNSTGYTYGTAYADADIINVGLDLDNRKFYTYKNGTIDDANGIDISSTTFDGFGSQWMPLVITYGSGGASSYEINFGGYRTYSIGSPQSDANGYGTFEYAPPTGYYALCTKNLAEFG